MDEWRIGYGSCIYGSWSFVVNVVMVEFLNDRDVVMSMAAERKKWQRSLMLVADSLSRKFLTSCVQLFRLYFVTRLYTAS